MGVVCRVSGKGAWSVMGSDWEHARDNTSTESDGW